MKSHAQLGKYLKMGEGIERKGIKFYKSALRRVVDMNSKSLLKFLIGEEEKHLKYFLYLEKRHIDGKKLPLLKKLKNPVFRKDIYKKVSKKDLVTYDLFSTALDIETKSINLYMKLSKKVKPKQLKKFLIMLAGREKGHYKLIKTHQDTLYESLYWEGIVRRPIEA